METNTKLVQQVDNATCTSACIAMLTGLPIMKIIGEFHVPYFKNQMDVSEYLDKLGLKFTTIMYTNSHMLDYKVDACYLAVVTDLADREKLHHILLNVKDGELEVLDPNKGRDNKRYYTDPTRFVDNGLNVPLTNFRLEYKFNYLEIDNGL